MRKSTFGEGSGSSPGDRSPTLTTVGHPLVSWLIGPAFLAVAAFTVFALPSHVVQTTATPAIREASISNQPVRTPMGDPPTTFINGFDRRCDDCHSIIDPRESSQADLQQHSNTVLQHGLNNSCLNCHQEQWVEDFYTDFIPAPRELAEESGDAARLAAAEALEKKLDEVLNSEDHKWFLGKVSPDEAAKRKVRQEEFKSRYND